MHNKLKYLYCLGFAFSMFTGGNAMGASLDYDLNQISQRVNTQIEQNIKLNRQIYDLIKIATISTIYSEQLFKDAVIDAIANKTNLLAIREALMQGAPYIGLSNTHKALIQLDIIAQELKINTDLNSSTNVNSTNRFAEGLKVQKQLFGQAIDTMHKNAKENEQLINVELLTAYCFGDFYTRLDLPLKTRELLTFVYIAALGAHNSQLQAHTIANLKIGNNKDMLLDVLKVMTPYLGFPRTLTALSVVNAVDTAALDSKTDEKQAALQAHAQTMVFPIGEKNDAYAQYFIGQSYLAPINTQGVGVYNVTFEPGCRNNWHIHKASNGGGQILICVSGEGYYQEWGKEAIKLKAGDSVYIAPNIKHWHGATQNSYFSHLAIEVPGSETSNVWLESVDDEHYLKLK